jgi:hypothetical protein
MRCLIGGLHCLEYYRLTKEDPFYDTGLNHLYWNFDECLIQATSIFSSIADYDPNRSILIAKIVLWGTDFEITKSPRMRNTEYEEYQNGYQYLSQALREWEQLINIATLRYRKLGDFDLI